ncbi:DUF1365 domain-containing protein [Malaciobacter molluscorum LMG 25693]|uniref:DUF1365 domain-containing protein n=1 Tax=Malaciobacter molluscorum LMG 25693 TaxID=870501 RepID=A0A2G1DJA6_9BACT|nr:DUF1365 domain-containing protein [Malaciobacter molluscorum]AXX91616.1 DUF1365 domain-containing protein [Malaciobacter molluscorum LMG 25693]PHO18589.1 DUF1365 domain-containing protein [Malaciobacter molluscorum LMG 25693]RXJ94580.1 DUF1365 domain-containing protein [Malaciobacter molluscorum]
MSHQFIEGKIYHKRFEPKIHDFTYGFYLLDIDLNDYNSLKNQKYFSINKLNLFSFYTKDHFGKSSDFLENVDELLNKFKIDKQNITLRFITLPRVCNFVFNPISLLLVIKDEVPIYMLAEVHNYNGGNIVYDLKLIQKDNDKFEATITKDMYVSPFFNRDGTYFFTLFFKSDFLSLKIDYYEKEQKSLTAVFSGKTLDFSSKNILKLFFKYWFLTLFVVTRTFLHALKLYKKGLSWHNPTKQDKSRRF